MGFPFVLVFSFFQNALLSQAFPNSLCSAPTFLPTIGPSKSGASNHCYPQPGWWKQGINWAALRLLLSVRLFRVEPPCCCWGCVCAFGGHRHVIMWLNAGQCYCCEMLYQLLHVILRLNIMLTRVWLIYYAHKCFNLLTKTRTIIVKWYSVLYLSDKGIMHAEQNDDHAIPWTPTLYRIPSATSVQIHASTLSFMDLYCQG